MAVQKRITGSTNLSLAALIHQQAVLTLVTTVLLILAVFEEPMVSAATTTRLIPVTTATSVEIPDELTLAQTLIEIKSTKPKAITTDATTVTPVFTRPKAKGFVFHDQDEQAPASKLIISTAQPSSKDKGGKLIQKLLLNQKYMGYLVHAYYIISHTRYYKDDSCWSADLKSKATKDIISIGNFMEVLALNNYVLIRKIL
ncbi:hypothetical protein Tco_0031387 [Tanacetum coccineum]